MQNISFSSNLLFGLYFNTSVNSALISPIARSSSSQTTLLSGFFTTIGIAVAVVSVFICCVCVMLFIHQNLPRLPSLDRSCLYPMESQMGWDWTWTSRRRRRRRVKGRSTRGLLKVPVRSTKGCGSAGRRNGESGCRSVGRAGGRDGDGGNAEMRE